VQGLAKIGDHSALDDLKALLPVCPAPDPIANPLGGLDCATRLLIEVVMQSRNCVASLSKNTRSGQSPQPKTQEASAISGKTLPFQVAKQSEAGAQGKKLCLN
jgi:hypothetical protein